MLKTNDSVKLLIDRAVLDLRSLLAQVPLIEDIVIHLKSEVMDPVADFVVDLKIKGRTHHLVCEVKSSGQPRHVRTALIQLTHFKFLNPNRFTPILVAPFLSEQSREMCRAQAVGFLDLEGNARIQFDGVFVERTVAGRPSVVRRELRSLFKPKSAQVLRVLLCTPQRTWRVTELARQAGVSLGHASNVRTALLLREWATASADGLCLSAPDALLDAWRDAYVPPAGVRRLFYTALHGDPLEEAARLAFSWNRPVAHAAYASFSAARWLAPYGRTGMNYFYADESGLERLIAALELTTTSMGENVAITLLKDPELLLDTLEAAPGIFCTSPVQTYLDLAMAGERGRESADHLRQQKLRWER